MENAVCQEMFQTGGHSKLILESFLCAGYANGQKDSCEVTRAAGFISLLSSYSINFINTVPAISGILSSRGK